MADLHHSCIGKLIHEALPEADPARIDLSRLKYLCDAPQRDIDWITSNAANDIQTLARGLALVNQMAADASPTDEDARALAELNVILGEMVAQLSLLAERAAHMAGREG